MMNGSTVAVVVPCYNEENQIGSVIDTMPDFVDRIVVVDDRSSDNTVDIVNSRISESRDSGITIKERSFEKTDNKFKQADNVILDMLEEERENLSDIDILNQNNVDNSLIVLISHRRNQGVGRSIATGYKWCKDHGIDCTAVMAGDGQMDPDELESICMPVINKEVGYSKGNRLIHKSSSSVIPKVRFLGNSVLSILTKIASGYWHVSDTQTGYTAISLDALESIRVDRIYRSYGMPNDMLVKLNMSYCKIKEVPIKPVYNVGERSKMRIFSVIPKLSILLVVLFFKRLWIKYLFRDFHPIFLLYNMSFVLLLVGLRYMVKIGYLWVTHFREINPLTILAFLFLFISGFQSLFFAMWMDVGENDRLYG